MGRQGEMLRPVTRLSRERVRGVRALGRGRAAAGSRVRSSAGSKRPADACGALRIARPGEGGVPRCVGRVARGSAFSRCQQCDHRVNGGSRAKDEARRTGRWEVREIAQAGGGAVP